MPIRRDAKAAGLPSRDFENDPQLVNPRGEYLDFPERLQERRRLASATVFFQNRMSLQGASGGPPSFRHNWCQTLRAPYRPMLSLWTALDRLEGFGVPFGLIGGLSGVAGDGGMCVVGQRSDQQDAADRLDTVGLAMLFNESDHLLNRRSSSAWAK